MAHNGKKVVVVGRQGHGKTKLSNTLFRSPCFPDNPTTVCRLKRHGQFEIVDTPGLVDTAQNKRVARQAETILDAMNLCPSPHAFLIVVKYEAFTAEEVSILDVLRIIFEENYFSRAIIVVTHIGNNITDDEFKNVCEEKSEMNELVKRCGQRIVRIDAMEPQEESINKILKYIVEVSQDGKSCFDDDLKINKQVIKAFADHDKYDSMLGHEQLEMISKEIKILKERENQKRKLRNVALLGIPVCLAGIFVYSKL